MGWLHQYISGSWVIFYICLYLCLYVCFYLRLQTMAFLGLNRVLTYLAFGITTYELQQLYAMSQCYVWIQTDKFAFLPQNHPGKNVPQVTEILGWIDCRPKGWAEGGCIYAHTAPIPYSINQLCWIFPPLVHCIKLNQSRIHSRNTFNTDFAIRQIPAKWSGSHVCEERHQLLLMMVSLVHPPWKLTLQNIINVNIFTDFG